MLRALQNQGPCSSRDSISLRSPLKAVGQAAVAPVQYETRPTILAHVEPPSTTAQSQHEGSNAAIVSPSFDARHRLLRRLQLLRNRGNASGGLVYKPC